MYSILVIGHTGQGKTTFVKKYLDKREHYIFDVNNEYAADGYNCAPHLEQKQFIDECQQEKNCVCVFEEATGFFKGRLSSSVDRLLVAKRHTNNTYIFVFHAIESIPPQIFRLVNYVVLFKTLDEASNVKRKYSRLYAPFLHLAKAPKFSKLILKMI